MVGNEDTSGADKGEDAPSRVVVDVRLYLIETSYLITFISYGRTVPGTKELVS